jgi:dolichol-phosphate mannosyltransferase
MVRYSIVIPARNEAGNIGALIAGIEAAMAVLGEYEIIVVDDASTDAMPAVLADRRKTSPALRVIRHDAKGGQSAAVHTGVAAARGALIGTLDGDGQNPPHHLPELFAPFLAVGSAAVGLVAGQRVGRQDTWSKKAASKFANGLRGWLLGDGTRDSGCGLKAFRREAFMSLPYFDHMHRYLPALFKAHGWEVRHVDVTHQARGAGRSNYSNLQRGLVGLVDLFGVMWLIRRRKKAKPVSKDS